MDSKRLDELLNRYWECETSVEEETELRDYFHQETVPEIHKEASALFRYFAENKKKSIKDIDFDAQILAERSRKKDGKLVPLFRNSMRIAAGIAVLIIATWFVRKEIRSSNPPEMEDTYSDPKMAFEETKKALMMISKGFTKAEQETKKINLFNEAQEEIQKSDSQGAQL